MPSKREFLVVYVVIAIANAALVAANVAHNAGFHWPVLHVLDEQLDMTQECTLAVWFSSAQLMLGSLAALALARFAPTDGPRGGSWRVIGWLGVAAMMLFLSVDETAQIHEWAAGRFDEYTAGRDSVSPALGVHDVFKWLIVFAPLALLAAGWLVAVAWSLRREHRGAFALCMAAVVCWLVTLAEEYAEGTVFQTPQGIVRGQHATIEEGCEIIGAAMFLIAFLELLRVRLGRGRSPRAAVS